MSGVRVKLNFEAMQILMGELQQAEMWAIYLMGQGKAMPDTVTKFDLTKIIQVLCKRLKWIEEESESDQEVRLPLERKNTIDILNERELALMSKAREIVRKNTLDRLARSSSSIDNKGISSI